MLARVFVALAILALASSQSVTLIPDNSDVGLSVQFVLTNDGEQPLTFVPWNTPLEGIFGDFFDVISSSGKRADYVGKLAKRAKVPFASEFITLLHGESRSARLDLSLHYDLGVDTWTVSLNTQLGVASSRTLPGQLLPALEFVPLKSDPVESVVAAVFPKLTQPEQSRVGDHIDCTQSESDQVHNAIVLAHNISKNALTYARSPCDPVYITWFGQYKDTLLRPEVGLHYVNIADRIETGFFNMNCAPPDCGSPSVFAYVYPTDTTYTVYLCGMFWRSPQTVAIDSQPGTLVHEFSHFRTIAGTQDYAYGTSLAQQLARQEPGKAVFNADNHEYFAEVYPHCG